MAPGLKMFRILFFFFRYYSLAEKKGKTWMPLRITIDRLKLGTYRK
jgi:hypothetical protein